ncbi:Crp/Fnr family transcriptional regulator [Flavihumibacter solisilvae]|uniref:Crp/Fnr family transcriptional regulator n=1 Tax=Flavihumibacter solisilvae TaxID=1349421 RepID=UPI00068DF41D|nr:Crp/Fnr family transcriptional regulator [Flavihumibacter solisilvae]
MQSPTALQLRQFRAQLTKFVEFSDEQWDLIASLLYLKSIKKKELFVSGDKVCNEVGFILQGSLRFFFVKDGIELSNYFCFQNELMSSYRSFLKRTPSIISIDAMEDSQLICFTYDSLQQLLADERTSFAMEHFGRMIAEYLICCYEERVFSFLTQTPEERYKRLIDEQPHFLNRIPQHYLANYLGVTAVSLSRIRKRIHESRSKQKLAS